MSAPVPIDMPHPSRIGTPHQTDGDDPYPEILADANRRVGGRLLGAGAVVSGGDSQPDPESAAFPVAVVNSDAGADGKQIVDGLVSGLNAEQFDVRVLSADEARRSGQGGNLRTCPDTVRLLGEAAGTWAGRLRPGQVTRPVITISTNPRAGELGSSIAGLTLGKAVNEISDKIGQQCTAQVAKASGAPLPGGVSLALTSPVDVQVNDFEPLPGGTGNGLSAFYYALLLLLAGFTGSIW